MTAILLTLVASLTAPSPSAAWAQGAVTAPSPAAETTLQEAGATVDPWEPLRLLEGAWEGEIDGILGVGVGRRSYEFVFDGVYLVSRHASVRMPQEESPEGDHHRELAVYSYDRERGAIVLREFMVEGYVIRSSCDTEPNRVVCVAEEVESGPGIRARLTLEIRDRFQFVEMYELAFPGQELRPYLTNTWTRAPGLEGSGPKG